MTGEEMLRALDKVSAAADPVKALRAEPKGIDWPQRVLRQTIFVSSIAAEILTDTGRADWDESCYEECHELLVQNQGIEGISVLVDREVPTPHFQHSEAIAVDLGQPLIRRP